jgi:hypothetical protein
MAGLSDIAGALSGKTVQPDAGALNKKGYNAAPFPKQNNPQLNAEAAAAQSGVVTAMHAHADKVHPVKGGY